jgi:hypothetical protein
MNTKEMEALLTYYRRKYPEVYVSTIGDEDYVWRTLTRYEYTELTRFVPEEDSAHERICSICVLYPENISWDDRVKAGIPKQLAPQILDASGYGPESKDRILYNVFSEQMQRLEAQAEVIIKTAFPDITFETMKHWTKEQLLWHLSRANWQLKIMRKVDMGIDDLFNPPPQEESDEPKESEVEKSMDDTIMEVARALRAEGQDPLFVLRDLIQKPKTDNLEWPFIGGAEQTDTMLAGVDAWREGVKTNGRYELIQQQVQKISGRRL